MGNKKIELENIGITLVERHVCVLPNSHYPTTLCCQGDKGQSLKSLLQGFKARMGDPAQQKQCNICNISVCRRRTLKRGEAWRNML